ncbi:hypothetical protein QUA56_33775 [Microcoleus sp. N3A4]|uniref:hypothetical protein n=1 Tax=Microcoleus sp. N3A4 TaxID=3055379 RepID=UPI002FCE8089
MYSLSQKDEVRSWAWALKRLGGYVSCQSYLIFLRTAICAVYTMQAIARVRCVAHGGSASFIKYEAATHPTELTPHNIAATVLHEPPNMLYSCKSQIFREMPNISIDKFDKSQEFSDIMLPQQTSI